MRRCDAEFYAYVCKQFWLNKTALKCFVTGEPGDFKFGGTLIHNSKCHQTLKSIESNESTQLK